MSESSTYNIDLNGNVIEATGLVIESGRPENEFLNTGYRSYIKIKFIAPDGITKEMVEEMKLTITTEGVDGGITENGITILDSTEEEIEEGIFYFNYTVAVDNDEKLTLPEITIDWGNGTETTYTLDTSGIEIQSYSDYIGITKPTIEDTDENGVLTGAGDVTYDINAELDEVDDNITNITIDGEVNNYETKTGLMSPTQLFNAGFSFLNETPGFYKIASISGSGNTGIYYKIIQNNFADNVAFISIEFVFAGTTTGNNVYATGSCSNSGKTFTKLYKKGNDIYANLLSGMVHICAQSNKTDSIFMPKKSEYTEDDLDPIELKII